MPRNYNLPEFLAPLRDPKTAIRALLGVLLFCNLLALYFIFFPLGGSPEELDRQLNSLRRQIREQTQSLDRAKIIASKVEKGRVQGDAFMQDYFLDSGNAYSTIVGDLVDAAKRASIRAKEHSYQTEPVEGSDDLSMMSIVGNYEGTYADLLHFVNEIDRSKRLVILENLSAQPQQGSGGILNVAVKFDAFVKEAPIAGGDR